MTSRIERLARQIARLEEREQEIIENLTSHEPGEPLEGKAKKLVETITNLDLLREQLKREIRREARG